MVVPARIADVGGPAAAAAPDAGIVGHDVCVGTTSAGHTSILTMQQALRRVLAMPKSIAELESIRLVVCTLAAASAASKFQRNVVEVLFEEDVSLLPKVKQKKEKKDGGSVELPFGFTLTPAPKGDPAGSSDSSDASSQVRLRKKLDEEPPTATEQSSSEADTEKQKKRPPAKKPAPKVVPAETEIAKAKVVRIGTVVGVGKRYDHFPVMDSAGSREIGFILYNASAKQFNAHCYRHGENTCRMGRSSAPWEAKPGQTWTELRTSKGRPLAWLVCWLRCCDDFIAGDRGRLPHFKLGESKWTNPFSCGECETRQCARREVEFDPTFAELRKHERPPWPSEGLEPAGAF